LVDKSLRATDNKIVVAILNGDFTVKRLKYKNNKAYLIAENKNYPPIILDLQSDIEGNYIWGVVTGVIRKF
jgi:DNA polymerase V